jgi:hypothetical protein
MTVKFEITSEATSAVCAEFQQEIVQKIQYCLVHTPDAITRENLHQIAWKTNIAVRKNDTASLITIHRFVNESYDKLAEAEHVSLSMKVQQRMNVINTLVNGMLKDHPTDQRLQERILTIVYPIEQVKSDPEKFIRLANVAITQLTTLSRSL